MSSFVKDDDVAMAIKGHHEALHGIASFDVYMAELK